MLGAEATAHDHPAHEYFIRHYDRILKGTTRALEGVARAGALHDGIRPASFATDLVALQDGLQLQWLLRPQHTAIAAPLEAFIQSALVSDLWAAPRHAMASLDGATKTDPWIG